MKCMKCGTEFQGNFCPECGAKAENEASLTPPPIQEKMGSRQQIIPPVFNANLAGNKETMKKPFYKSKWFVIIVVVLALGVIGSLTGHKYNKKNKADVSSIAESTKKESTAEKIKEKVTEPTTTEETEEKETKESTTEETSEIATEESSSSESEIGADGMRTDFKEAMDSYESFMNEYCDFMAKYNANPSDPSLITDYATYMTKYAVFAEKFEKWDSEEMNDAETAYYLQVQARVAARLAEVAQ